MRTEKQFSVLDVLGKWMCLAGLAGMAGMFAMGIFAPHQFAALNATAMNVAAPLTVGMFGCGFAIWMFQPEPDSTRRFWKWGFVLALLAGAAPLIVRKFGELPAVVTPTALVCWLGLCAMAAMVCARRWHTLDDARDAGRRAGARLFGAAHGASSTPAHGGEALFPASMLTGLLTAADVAAMEDGDERRIIAAHHMLAFGTLFPE